MAKLIVEQLFDNCLIAADMLDHPRTMLDRLNSLLEKTADSLTNAAPAPAAPQSALKPEADVKTE
jgi:TNF receptor-associated protein 1